MKLGPYDLVSELGRGAMGVVYRARHLPTGAERAVKVIELDRSDWEAFERFQREAASLARVDGQPNIVRVHETGVEGKRAFYAMDLVEGRSLKARLAEGPLDARTACVAGAKIARAIAHCHASGIIHRDLKPDNVLLDAAGEPKLVDFGLVRDLGAQKLTHTGSFLGTPAYMSPEQVLGQRVSWATDVHALGVILYESLTGRRPHEGRTVVELAQSLTSGRLKPIEELAPGIPAPLAALVKRALAREPEERPKASEVARELEAIARSLKKGKETVAAGKVRVFDRTLRALGAVAVALALALVALLLRPTVDPRSEAREELEALGGVARARAFSSDIEALLAAQTAMAIAAATSETVPWELCEAGLQAALARTPSEFAVALATSALAVSPPERRADLLLLRARALLASGDGARALADVTGLEGDDALRLRARALVALRRWSELAALPAGSVVAGERAIGRMRAGSASLDEARGEAWRAGARKEVLSVFEEERALREIAAVVSLDGPFGPDAIPDYVLRAQTQPAFNLSHFVVAAEVLETALEAPALLDRARDLAAIDRALEAFERDLTGFYPLLSKEPGKHEAEAVKLVDAFERRARALARTPAEALSPRIRVQVLMGSLGHWGPDEEDRYAFLLGSVRTAPLELQARLRCAIFTYVEGEHYLGKRSAFDTFHACEETIAFVDEKAFTASGISTRLRLEVAAAELCIRAITEDPAREAELLEEAARHLAIAQRICEAGHSDQHYELARGKVTLALARRDAAAARAAQTPIIDMNRIPEPWEQFLAGEVARVNGAFVEAEGFDDLAIQGAQHRSDALSTWYVLDSYFARELARLERARATSSVNLERDALARLAQIDGKRAGHARPLPWIEKEVRAALGR